MAQNDKEHFGDIQNPPWWGYKQGLFINALANQFGQITVDANFQNNISQNVAFSIESYANGGLVLSNSIFGSLLSFLYLGGDGFPAPFVNFKSNVLLFSSSSSNRRSGSDQTVMRSVNNLFYCATTYNPIFPITINNFNSYTNRVKNFNKVNASAATNSILNTDDLFPIGQKVLRLNYGDALSGALAGQYVSGVVRDIRIYSRILTDKEISDNYHYFSVTDTSNLFIEWKMSQLSDFYVYDNKLYARNTGTSGNTNQDGTGYDMQLIGYNLNTPIFQSIY